MGDIKTIERLRTAFGGDAGADVGEEARQLIEVIEPVLDPDIEVKMAAGQIEQPAAAVWCFRDGLLRRIEFHIDREAARQSAAEGAA